MKQKTLLKLVGGTTDGVVINKWLIQVLGWNTDETIVEPYSIAITRETAVNLVHRLRRLNGVEPRLPRGYARFTSTRREDLINLLEKLLGYSLPLALPDFDADPHGHLYHLAYYRQRTYHQGPNNRTESAMHYAPFTNQIFYGPDAVVEMKKFLDQLDHQAPLHFERCTRSAALDVISEPTK
jgi:hypothetical protein